MLRMVRRQWGGSWLWHEAVLRPVVVDIQKLHPEMELAVRLSLRSNTFILVNSPVPQPCLVLAV